MKPETPQRQETIPFASGAAGTIGSRRRIGGFTLIDLLVSMVVVAVLISILAPSLMKSYEMARRVICASNMRQIGYALDMYADDNDELLPGSVLLKRANSNANANVQNTMFLRFATNSPLTGTNTSTSSTGPGLIRWDGLGFLYEQRYLSHPGVFYCPSHHGEHGVDVYENEWSDFTQELAGNFQYRVDTNYRLRSELPSGITLVADAMRSQQDYNHIQGNNMLRGDLSIAWFEDVNGDFYSNLPFSGDEPSAAASVTEAWKVLDEHNGIPDEQVTDIGPITAGHNK